MKRIAKFGLMIVCVTMLLITMTVRIMTRDYQLGLWSEDKIALGLQ